MMLRAIAIYEEEQTESGKKLKKVRAAESLKILQGPLLFTRNEEHTVKILEHVDKQLLDSDFYQTMQSGKPYILRPRVGEINYIYQPPNSTHVLVISSKQPLDPVEKAYLFTNIGHIYRNPKVGVTLGQIINQPLAYTGRDILMDRIQGEIDQTIAKMHKNIEISIKRKELIDQLEEKALVIGDHASLFDNRAKRYNSYCCS